jgi:hypothetical protein
MHHAAFYELAWAPEKLVSAIFSVSLLQRGRAKGKPQKTPTPKIGKAF